jgi:1,4-alpha-glucan branching enzyme
VEPDYLRYRYLNNFDRAMITLAHQEAILDEKPELFVQDEEKKILIFRRKNCIFALNFNPTESFADYGFAAPAGKYEVVLNTDESEFDGFSRIKTGEVHFSVHKKSENGNGKYKDSLSLYIPSRTAIVLKKLD